MPKNYCIMQIWAESGKSALPICNYSQILYQFLTFTQNLKRSRKATFVLQPKVAFSFEIISYAYADQMSDNSSLFGTEGIPPLF